MTNSTDGLAERLLARTQRDPSGCLLWTGSLRGGGYGRIRVAGRTEGVHRVAYRLWVGPIPDGQVIDHACHGEALGRGECGPGPCDHRRCVDPEHLRPLTVRENLLVGATVNAEAASRVSCIRGHPLWGDNLMVRRSGKRECRTCHRAQVRAWRLAHPSRGAPS